MAFHDLIFKQGLQPSNPEGIVSALNNLTQRIDIGQKHIKMEDRLGNIRVVKGLISDCFVKTDVPSLAHGPGMIFDFENSIRRSRTETARYEFKQGILRLSAGRSQDKALLHSLLETMCAIANVGPGTDGFLYIGIADKPQDAARIAELDTIHPIIFEHLQIVGIEREAKVMGISLEHYMRILQDTITNSRITEPLKTQLGSSIDVINYKGMLVVRLRIPKQTGLNFIGDECFIRNGSSTERASGPKIAAASKLFS